MAFSHGQHSHQFNATDRIKFQPSNSGRPSDTSCPVANLPELRRGAVQPRGLSYLVLRRRSAQRRFGRRLPYRTSLLASGSLGIRMEG